MRSQLQLGRGRQAEHAYGRTLIAAKRTGSAYAPERRSHFGQVAEDRESNCLISQEGSAQVGMAGERGWGREQGRRGRVSEWWRARASLCRLGLKYVREKPGKQQYRRQYRKDIAVRKSGAPGARNGRISKRHMVGGREVEREGSSSRSQPIRIAQEREDMHWKGRDESGNMRERAETNRHRVEKEEEEIDMVEVQTVSSARELTWPQTSTQRFPPPSPPSTRTHIKCTSTVFLESYLHPPARTRSRRARDGRIRRRPDA